MSKVECKLFGNRHHSTGSGNKSGLCHRLLGHLRHLEYANRRPFWSETYFGDVRLLLPKLSLYTLRKGLLVATILISLLFL